jgi:putative restriction endonuclease
MFDDRAIRAHAFDWVRRMRAIHGLLSADLLATGFEYEGTQVPLISRQRGIWKPRILRWVLSIKTVMPRKGGRVWYRDQERPLDEIFAARDTLSYAFQGDDPAAFDNQWLREAHDHKIPLIYFVAVSPGRYEVIQPVFVDLWDPASLSIQVSIGDALENTVIASEAGLPDDLERRYNLRLTKQRLHQATFRERVLHAYGHRCAISGLPEPQLLDAAHIVPDADEKLGHPVVANGLALSKVHHAAFDAHLIGVDSDLRIHISERLLELHDGPFLEIGIKSIRGQRLRPPRDPDLAPDRNRLAQRFEEFQSTH